MTSYRKSFPLFPHLLSGGPLMLTLRRTNRHCMMFIKMTPRSSKSIKARKLTSLAFWSLPRYHASSQLLSYHGNMKTCSGAASVWCCGETASSWGGQLIKCKGEERGLESLHQTSVLILLIVGIVALGAFNKKLLKKRQGCGCFTHPLTGYVWDQTFLSLKEYSSGRAVFAWVLCSLLSRRIAP